MRHHFVFFARCGCPLGLVEKGSGCRNEDEAWDVMYETRSEERAARARSVHVELLDHPTYEREVYPKMTEHCPH